MTSTEEAPSQKLADVLDLLDEVGDIISGRVNEPSPPAWCRSRGWTSFLRGLSDDEVRTAEHEGLATVIRARDDAPEALRSISERVSSLCLIEAPRTTEIGEAQPVMLRASPRKSAQVTALANLARRHLATPRRIVDVGAGHGHLTRALARALGADAVGLDRDVDRVVTARALSGSGVRFERWDGATSELVLGAGDLAVGLHACGDLGDVLVRRAADARSDVLLVSCCLQKIAAESRRPLSVIGRARGFVAPRPLLGLANLAARAEGVEDSMSLIMESRRTRYALRLVLAGRSVDCSPGEETRGINRRRMRQGLAVVARMALDARGLPPASEEELAVAEAHARTDFALIRRLSLPRALLARLLELAVVLDRATALEDAGHDVRVVTAFASSDSPRNLAIVAPAAR